MLKKAAIILIKAYQNTISVIIFSVFGNVCRFNLSCSDYSIGVIRKFGVLKGGLLTLGRLLKCHPYSDCRIEYFSKECSSGR